MDRLIKYLNSEGIPFMIMNDLIVLRWNNNYMREMLKERLVSYEELNEKWIAVYV